MLFLWSILGKPFTTSGVRKLALIGTFVVNPATVLYLMIFCMGNVRVWEFKQVFTDYHEVRAWTRDNTALTLYKQQARVTLWSNLFCKQALFTLKLLQKVNRIYFDVLNENISFYLELADPKNFISSWKIYIYVRNFFYQ